MEGNTAAKIQSVLHFFVFSFMHLMCSKGVKSLLTLKHRFESRRMQMSLLFCFYCWKFNMFLKP